MDFEEILDQAVAMIQRRGRVSYSALRRKFDLDDAYLADVKEELLYAHASSLEDDGRGFVWRGEEDAIATVTPTTSHPQSPSTYTPQHLAERIRAEQQAMESRGVTDGERKTITALFADLKGSTALIEGLDPEDARAIIDPALQLMMDAVHRYDGYVAQALGDGIFALFGAPIAHEDHPQRAVYAALRMQEEMRGYADTLREQGRPPLLMRVGLNTGEVVVRSIRKDDLHADYVPVGHSTNLAARMEQLAAPGSILVSEYTHKLTDGYFAFKDMGKTQIKGVDEPLNVYEVTGAGPLRTRLQVSARRGLTRFVGRHNEMKQLQAALDQAKAGHGQIVGVMGEPGLGKSRLFHEFKLTSQSECLVLEAFAVSHGQNSPYLPLIELLKEYFQIEPTDDERQRQSKIMGQVLTLDRSLEDTLPYLFALLGIADEESSLKQMDAQVRRQRTFEALKKLFLRENLNQPLIVVVEDLHWIDSETQGFLDALTDSVASANVLLLVNYRPEYRHEWSQKIYYTQLRLTPLGKAEAGEFLTFLLGNEDSLSALKPLILEKTDGTPFFMEEVVQTLAEEGSLVGKQGHYQLETTPSALSISSTVQGVLAARIDRLAPDEKALLQQLAVIGRQFPASLVKQVVSQSEADLYRLLASLQAKEFLYEQPAFPESEYLFKHALTQDVAYGTVLQEQRKALHERTGQALEILYEEKVEDHYSDLAHHYSQSANTEKAVEYLYLAGQQAVQRAAYDEAVSFLTQGLALLQTLPETLGRVRQELQLQKILGQALQVTKGMASPEVEQTYTQALALCQQGQEPQQFLPVLGALCTLYLVRADLEGARERAEQCLVLAQQTGDSALLLLAHSALGLTCYFQGDLSSAREQFEQGIQLYDPQQHAAHSALYPYGMDAGALCLSQEAPLLCHLGYPDRGEERLQEGFALAQASDPYTLAATSYNAACYHLYRREGRMAQERAEAVIALSQEYEFPYWGAWATTVRGWAWAVQGQGEAGIAEIERGMVGWQDTGARVGQGWALTLLGETYATAGRIADGLKALDEAIRDPSTPFFKAEAYRLRGELLLQQGAAESEAEISFRQAIDIACKQAAKSFELRAATSLARLWQGQGKVAEARELLAPAYNWFTEGFDTADLKDAKALLDALVAR